MNRARRAAFGTVLVATVLFASQGGEAAPARDGDPVLIGTKWKGKLTQKGEFPGGAMGPPLFDVVMTVTKRDGEAFEADLREESGEIKVTYVVKGTVVAAAGGKSYTVAFKSVDARDVVNTSAVLGVSYTGTLAGKTLKGTWKIAPNAGTDISGDFTLELSK